MSRFHSSLLLPLLLATPLLANAASSHYRLDPVHTRVLFAIDHAGFSKALGTVSGSQGSLDFDPDDWRHAQLQVTVPLNRLDLGDPDWNKAALGRRLLDAAKFAEAHFVSTRVEPLSKEHARVFGDLTLHGTTHEIVLDVQLNAVKRQPMPPFRRTVGFSASTTLQRSDFGIDAWSSMIGDQVHLQIEVEAERDHHGNGDDT